MSTIGQIVYNLQDYTNSGGFISTAQAKGNNNTDQTITSAIGWDTYVSGRIDLFNQNLVKRYPSQNFIKLGVQAPPGTRFVLNGSRTIMVGRTGTYELDSDIIVTDMRFIRPLNYIPDLKASSEALRKGQEGMLAAEEKRSKALNELDNKFPEKTIKLYWKDLDSPTGLNGKLDKAILKASNPEEIEYWEQYNQIQEVYLKEYYEALGQYNMGLNGIYRLPNTQNPDSPDNYKELYNIIIDFLY